MKSKKLQTTAIASALALSLMCCCAASAASPTPAAVSTAASAAESYTGTSIVFTDSGISAAASDGLKIEGTDLTITQSGTYLLSGTASNGSIKVKKGTTGVTLVLQGLNLTAESTAPIVCAKSTEVTIIAAAGTENTLADTENNNTDSGNADAENAVIKCKDGSNVTLCGTGILNILANGKNGIKSGASTQEEGNASLTIADLTLNITAPSNDAINAEAALDVESGTLSISAGDDALHCDYTLNIGAEGTAGPSIAIASCYEGLEGATVNVYSGDVTIEATDDCINAANPSLSGYQYQLNISGGTVIAYTSTGDGFDSNGDMTISGGTVAVWSANTADNSPLDADGTVTISGGTVLAAGGSSGMGMNLDAQQPCVIFGNSTGMGGGMNQMQQPNRQAPDAQAPSVQQQSNWEPGGMSFGGAASLLAQNSAFTILDAQGNDLYSGTARCGTSFLLFSAPGLSDSCTLSADGSDTTAEVQSGTVSTGMGGMGGMGFHGGFPGGREGGQRPEGKDFNFGDKPENMPQAAPDGSGV